MSTGRPRGRARTVGAASEHPLERVLWRVHALGALALAVTAALTSWGFLVWCSALAAGAALLYRAVGGAGRDAARRVRADGPRVRVALRRALPVSLVVFVPTLSAFLIVASGTPQERPGVRVFAFVAGVLLLTPVPDLVRVLLTRQEVVLGVERLEVRSWGRESVVDWGDVTGTSLDPNRGRHLMIVIHTRPGATSLRQARRGLVLPLEPRPPADQILLSFAVLDEPWLMHLEIGWLTHLGAAQRARHLEVVAVPLLTARLLEPVPEH